MGTAGPHLREPIAELLEPFDPDVRTVLEHRCVASVMEDGLVVLGAELIDGVQPWIVRRYLLDRALELQPAGTVLEGCLDDRADVVGGVNCREGNTHLGVARLFKQPVVEVGSDIRFMSIR